MKNGYPFIDLHRHLDGNVRLSTIIDLAKKYKLDLPAWEPELLRPYVQVTQPEPDLLGFLSKFELLTRVLVDYECVKRITRENLEDACQEGIDYIELRFSPFFMSLAHHLDPFSVTEAACEAVYESIQRLPIQAKLIVIMSRTYGPSKCQLELDAALRFQEYGIVGVDLAGDEANFPGKLFTSHFCKAREGGLHVIAHAGEAAGPESVRQAVEELEVERIGHGVRAVEDEQLLEEIKQRNIAIECCLTSNVQTSAVKSYQEHPLPKFLEKGLLVTINTDDPVISGVDLPHEYQVAQQELGLKKKQIIQLQKNALEAAFLSKEEKESLVHQLQGQK